MAQTSSSPPQAGLARRNFGIALIVLLGALLLFFAPSFNPNKVLFANDGPLGAAMAKNIQPPQSMFGVWLDLNWIGAAGGTYVPCFTFFLFWGLGPLYFSKFYGPICLLFLGISAWLFFRQKRWHPAVCAIGALAAMLNMNGFSNVAWGLGTRATSLGCVFLALAAFEASKKHKWPGVYLVLGGLAVGMSVAEGADNGALYSIFVAAYVFISSWQESGRTVTAAARGAGAVAVVAVFAGMLAAQSIGYLVPTAVKPLARGNPTEEDKQQAWDFATQWSLPKKEIIRVLIPGMFGYRLDTPNGGAYWGTVGRQPGWEQHHQGFVRHSGAGEYAGVFVVLVAAWAVAQGLRGKDGPSSPSDRTMVRFLSATALVCTLLAFGRHGFLYRVFYAVPYMSSIRNPIKFMQTFQLALLILFGYGMQSLIQRCLTETASARNSLIGQLKLWWSKAVGFERKWVYGMVGFVALSLLGWMIYSSSSRELTNYLVENGFEAPEARQILDFSKGEIGLYLLFLTASIAIFLLIQSGAFGGARLKWGAIVVALVLTIDLSRANAPWVRYYDYKLKYASNPIVDFLARAPYEHRVSGRLMPMAGGYLANDRNFVNLLSSEWMQHLFLYYNIQALDINQMPRMPENDKAFLGKLQPPSDSDLTPAGRLWQLTNARYILGMKTFLPILNERVDPTNHGFRVHTSFEIVPKPGVAEARSYEELTAVEKPDGRYALFENTQALPRAVLIPKWQVSTNDEATLNEIANPAFDPKQTVVVAENVPLTSTGGINAPGTVEYVSYSPKEIKLKAKAEAPSILLLNDKYDSEWHVYVDGKQEKLLRCNYIMRGVAVGPGNHSVDFRYEPALHGLFTTLGGVALALVLCCVVPFIPERIEPQRTEPQEAQKPARARVV